MAFLCLKEHIERIELHIVDCLVVKLATAYENCLAESILSKNILGEVFTGRVVLAEWEVEYKLEPATLKSPPLPVS
jgi:hypothetical protein